MLMLRHFSNSKQDNRKQFYAKWQRGGVSMSKQEQQFLLEYFKKHQRRLCKNHEIYFRKHVNLYAVKRQYEIDMVNKVERCKCIFIGIAVLAFICGMGILICFVTGLPFWVAIIILFVLILPPLVRLVYSDY